MKHKKNYKKVSLGSLCAQKLRFQERCSHTQGLKFKAVLCLRWFFLEIHNFFLQLNPFYLCNWWPQGPGHDLDHNLLPWESTIDYTVYGVYLNTDMNNRYDENKKKDERANSLLCFNVAPLTTLFTSCSPIISLLYLRAFFISRPVAACALQRTRDKHVAE